MDIMPVKKILIFIVLMSVCSCAHGMKTDKNALPVIPLNAGVSDSAFLTDLEKAIINKLNVVRSHPKQYAEFLKSLDGKSHWNKGLDEATVFIEKTNLLPPFKASRGLSRAAQILVNDRGPDGLTGHTLQDGTTMLDRMNTYGRLEGKAGEYLGYGYSEAEALVARIAIDEGAAGSEGNLYLFDNNFLIIGVACGPHKTRRTMCAIDFAHSFRENLPPQ
jgi:hypothetical protein